MPSTPVLLIEDNPADAGLVRAWLEDRANGDYEVEHVGSLEEVAPQRSYDVAILDLGLPRSDGIETLVRFRELLPTCPVVIFTGSDDERIAADAAQHDVAAVMHKDAADSRSLSETLLRIVGGRRRERSLAELAAELRDRLFALQAGADALNEGLVVFTSHGQVTFANLAARDLLGVTSRADLPQPLQQIEPSHPAEGRVTTATGERHVEVTRCDLPGHASKRRFHALLVRPHDEPPPLDPLDSLALVGMADALAAHARAMVVPAVDANGMRELDGTLDLQAHAAAVLELALQLRRRVHRLEGRTTRRPEPPTPPLSADPPRAAVSGGADPLARPTRTADDVILAAAESVRPRLPDRAELRLRLRAAPMIGPDPDRLARLVEHLVQGVAELARDHSQDPIRMLLRSAPAGDALSLVLEILGPADSTVFPALSEALVGERVDDGELAELHRCLHELDATLSLPQHTDGSTYVDIRIGG